MFLLGKRQFVSEMTNVLGQILLQSVLALGFGHLAWWFEAFLSRHNLRVEKAKSELMEKSYINNDTPQTLILKQYGHHLATTRLIALKTGS